MEEQNLNKWTDIDTLVTKYIFSNQLTYVWDMIKDNLEEEQKIEIAKLKEKAYTGTFTIKDQAIFELLSSEGNVTMKDVEDFAKVGIYLTLPGIHLTFQLFSIDDQQCLNLAKHYAVNLYHSKILINYHNKK